MIATGESYVAATFDRLEAWFKEDVSQRDYRLSAIIEHLGDLQQCRILDLGCGKGRFARKLKDLGAEVVGLDLSAGMLAKAAGLSRVQASARRLPFADSTFDAVIAIEVLEHVDSVAPVLDEAFRVLRPGGQLAIIDKSAGALNVDRPWLPALLVKRIDEQRGRWMYPADAPVRERWFWPRRFSRLLAARFDEVQMFSLLREPESKIWIFRWFPWSRLIKLWVGRKPDLAQGEKGRRG